MRIVHCLPVNVYRYPAGDCTNGGLSSRFDELLVACKTGHRTFDADLEIPLNFCMVRKRWIYNALTGESTAHMDVVPAMIDDAGCVVQRPGWWMYGGNIAESSDSRFRELAGGLPYPLHIHDRKEW